MELILIALAFLVVNVGSIFLHDGHVEKYVLRDSLLQSSFMLFALYLFRESATFIEGVRVLILCCGVFGLVMYFSRGMNVWTSFSVRMLTVFCSLVAVLIWGIGSVSYDSMSGWKWIVGILVCIVLVDIAFQATKELLPENAPQWLKTLLRIGVVDDDEHITNNNGIKGEQ